MTRQTQQEVDDIRLLQNSIERVINTSMQLIEKYVPDHEDMKGTNLLDWEDLKYLTVQCWNIARNEAYKRGQK